MTWRRFWGLLVYLLLTFLLAYYCQQFLIYPN